MAENEALIPYPHNREIVLRQKDSVVVYSPASKKLVVRRSSPDDSDEEKCPYCHRSLHQQNLDNPPVGQHEAAPPAAAPFASPEYFRMLQSSLPPSQANSRPPSPRRRLTHHHLGLETASPLQAPPDAEFISSSPAPEAKDGISSAAFSPNYFNGFFKEERELGRGGKGVVLLVKHVLDGVSLGHFALKRIPVGDDHGWLEKVLVEVQLLQHLSHQNLVSYRHVWLEDFQISQFGPSVPCVFILQQYCNAGDLHSFVLQGMDTTTTKEQMKERMRRRSRHEPEPPEDIAAPRRLHFEEIRSFFKDITAGINHLHTNEYIHRDLKPNNCLLHDSGKGIRVLVSDFGEVQSENQVRQSSGATGTISYCAPEVLRVDPTTGQLGNFTAKSDIFSLGLILYFMTFGCLPYANADNLHEENEDVELLREEILAWAGVNDTDNNRLDLPEKLFKFLGRLLSLDPEERPTAEEALQASKTGAGVEGFSDARAKATSPPFEGMRRRSKISPFEGSASEPTPETVGMQRQFSGDRRRSSPPRQIDIPPRRSVHDFAVEEEADTDGESPGSTIITTTAPASPSGSLVLRSRHASPAKLATAVASPARLADVADEAHRRRRRRMLVRPERLHALQIAVLFLKIFSVYAPCQPVAARPDVGLALLGLAALDLLLPRPRLAATLALLAAHAVALYALARSHLLCLPRDSLWAAAVEV